MTLSLLWEGRSKSMRKNVRPCGSRLKMADRFLTSFPGRIWGTQRSKLTGFRSLSVPQKGEQRTLEGRQLRVMKLDHLPSKLISQVVSSSLSVFITGLLTHSSPVALGWLMRSSPNVRARQGKNCQRGGGGGRGG